MTTEPLDAPGPDEVVKAIEDNWYGWLPLFERLDGGRVEHRDGYVRWRSAIPMPFFNGICGVPASGDLDAGIDDALAAVRGGRAPAALDRAPAPRHR